MYVGEMDQECGLWYHVKGNDFMMNVVDKTLSPLNGRDMRSPEELTVAPRRLANLLYGRRARMVGEGRMPPVAPIDDANKATFWTPWRPADKDAHCLVAELPHALLNPCASARLFDRGLV